MNWILPIELVISIASGVTNFNSNELIQNLIYERVSAIESISNLTFDNKKIEYIKKINNFDTCSDNYYIDFEGDSGYIVLDKDLNVLFYDFNVEIEELKSDEVFEIMGFDFFKNGKKIERKMQNNCVENNVFSPGSIAIQYDDYIEYNEIDSFISSKYGQFNLTLSDSDKLDGYSQGCNSFGFTQFEESVYVKRSGNTTYSEGNCGLVSTANILSYYADYGGINSLPTSNDWINIIPFGENIYNDAIELGYEPKNFSVNIHEVYGTLRNHAISQGYLVSGMNDTQTNYAFINTLEEYQCIGAFQPFSSYSLLNITLEINSNRPLQFRTQGDVKYGGHGTMITGYRVYNGSAIINNVTINSQLVMISIFDGHSASERWYDLTYLSSFSSEYSRADSQTIATTMVLDSFM